MIIIPMAGISSRFFKAGYNRPKYMLEAYGKTLFEHAVSSFEHYFSTEKFLFIVRDVYQTAEFVRHNANKIGIKNFSISILKTETRGQAETIALGLTELRAQKMDINGAITIFNIDTFRPNFRFPDLELLDDGYLEVFTGSGDNWSFAKPISPNSTRVCETAEKKPISNLCCTGLYYFSDVSQYLDAYERYLKKPKSEWDKGELYVAPLYNLLIEKKLKIHYNLIKQDDVIFCGVPDEYINFLNSKQ